MRGARSLPRAAGALSKQLAAGRRKGLRRALHLCRPVWEATDQMGLSHKKFLWGRARIYKQYAARGNANNNVDLPFANFVNFQKKFFP